MRSDQSMPSLALKGKSSVDTEKASVDVFGTSLNDFDPFAEDDGGGGDADFGAGGTNDFRAFEDDVEQLKGEECSVEEFGELVDFGAFGSSDEDEEFFRSASSFESLEMTEEKTRRSRSRSAEKDQQQQQQEEERKTRGRRASFKKPALTKEMNSSLGTLNTTQSGNSTGSGSNKSRSSRSRSPRAPPSRRTNHGRSRGCDDGVVDANTAKDANTTKDQLVVSEESSGNDRSGSSSSPRHGPSRRPNHRSRSTDTGSSLQPVDVASDDEVESGDKSSVPQPPVRRRNSNRRAVTTQASVSPTRRSRSRSLERVSLSVPLEESDEEDKNRRDSKAASSLVNRRAGISNHRPLPSKRLLANNATSATIRNLFREDAKSSTDSDNKSVGDDGKKTSDEERCKVALTHSVIQRPPGRRGNLNRNFSGVKSPAVANDDHGPTRSVTRTNSMNHKLHNDRSVSERRLIPQRTASSDLPHRRQSSRDLFLSPGSRLAAAKGGGDVLSPRRAPPKSASMGGSLNRRSQLQRQSSGKTRRSREQKEKKEEEG